ncbi:MAG TPA: hypothetical protein VLE50_04875 [Cellvibrio sp.]|nr:hypothetical protein [Cellvibrio sp.]
MKHFLWLIGLASCGFIVNAQADCVADISVSDAHQLLQRGEQLEREGNLYEALHRYKAAQGYVCEDGGNPVAGTAARKAAELAIMQGKKAEAHQLFYSDGQDKPGAFQWYEIGGHYAAADRALVAALKQQPEDRNLSAKAQEHFYIRAEEYFIANNQLRIRITGSYKVDPIHVAYVRQLPYDNVGKLLSKTAQQLPDAYLQELAALEKQKHTIKPGDIAANIQLQQDAGQFEQRWRSDRVKDVSKLFYEATDWTRQMRDYAEAEQLRKRIDSVKLAHADKLLTHYAHLPEVFSQAMDYYQEMDLTGKINQARKQANQFAEKAMADNFYERAARYYRIAGEDAKEDLANMKYQEQSEQLSAEMSAGYAQQAAELQQLYNDPEKIRALQQQALEMQKQLQQQSDNNSFQAEQDDLEAELGL